MEYYKKQKPSEETLIRKGDIVYRVNKSDGSGRGNFKSGGGGYSPHSDRRHGNSAAIEDLFHKADDGDQMAKQELDKRGLWLDMRRSNVFAQPTGELLNQLELTRDFEPTRRMKERRKMLVVALMDRNEVLGEEFVNASSTEELYTMRNTYNAFGRPPHFTKTAQLIEVELAKRESRANASDYAQVVPKPKPPVVPEPTPPTDPKEPTEPKVKKPYIPKGGVDFDAEEAAELEKELRQRYPGKKFRVNKNGQYYYLDENGRPIIAKDIFGFDVVHPKFK